MRCVRSWHSRQSLWPISHYPGTHHPCNIHPTKAYLLQVPTSQLTGMVGKNNLVDHHIPEAEFKNDTGRFIIRHTSDYTTEVTMQLVEVGKTQVISYLHHPAETEFTVVHDIRYEYNYILRPYDHIIQRQRRKQKKKHPIWGSV